MNNAPPCDGKNDLVDIAGWTMSRKKCDRLAILALLILTVAMFADVIFTPRDIVLGDSGGDMVTGSLHWRHFGFGELRKGNLALWNPHVYSGVPCFSMFINALLYPPNVVFLIFPIAKAMNISIALHVFWAGVFMYWWAARRRLHPLASLLCAVLWMFCGPHWIHICGGQIVHLCSMIWVPLLFVAIDGAFEEPELKWVLLGIFALAMQILAGHPQYCFYTGLAAGLYSVLRLIRSEQRMKVFLALAGMAIGGAVLTTVQWLSAVEATKETVRNAGLAYSEAAGFSFPPENFLTLVAPGFFGGDTMNNYWGRWFLWEVSAFVGVCGLMLAVLGAVSGDRKQRQFAALLALIFFVLALGGYTPLFRLLHHLAPGFDKFRTQSRYISLAAVFLILLAGVGFDKIIREKRAPRWFVIVSFTFGFCLCVGSCAILLPGSAEPASWWRSILQAMSRTSESYLAPPMYSDPQFLLASARRASWSLLAAGATAFVFAAFVFLVARSRRFIAGIFFLSLLELLVFAWSWRDSFDWHEVDIPPLREFLRTHPGDYRILNLLSANMTTSLGGDDIWGDEAAVIRRYAEFMAFSQGLSPDEANQTLRFRKMGALLRLVRCGYVVRPKPGKKLEINELANPLPRFLLVHGCRVLKEREAILATLNESSFDPEKEVVLEQTPEPMPAVSQEKGTVRLIDSSTDHFTLEVRTSQPALLLITDAYSKDWKANPLAGSVQQKYEILPADYCLRAVPLTAGEHHLRIEYLPRAFVVGKWISIAALIFYFTALGWRWNGRLKQRTPQVTD